MNDPFGNAPGKEWATRTFTATVHAAAQARDALSELIQDTTLAAQTRDDLELLISELVTNAVVHTASDKVCVSVRSGDPLRVCVRDNGLGTPELARVDVGGWGLRLVDMLSTAWGVSRVASGKVIWFDLRTEPVASRP